MRHLLASLLPTRLLVAGGAVAASVAFAGAALAEEAEHGGENTLMKVDVPVAVATIVTFLLLLVILAKFAWKPILAGLKAREEGIREAIDGAERANAEAKRVLAEYQEKLTAATAEAKAIVEEGRKDAEMLRSRIEADAKTAAQEERARTAKDIDLAKDAALKEIYERVADLSTEVASKILQQRLDPQQHRRLVDETIASFEGSRKRPGARA